MRNEAPLCACGCGESVQRSLRPSKHWNKYLLGHSRRGKKHKKRTRTDMSKLRKAQVKEGVGVPPSRAGTKHSEEAKRKNAEAHRGLVPWNKGKRPSDETRKKQSEAAKRRTRTPEFEAMRIAALRKAKAGTTLSERHRKILSKRMKENNPADREYSEEEREQRRQRMLGANNHNYGRPMPEETRQKMIASKKAFFEKMTGEKRSAWMKHWHNWQKRPTSIEQWLIDAAEDRLLPLRYVGNGKYWVAGLNPDFVSTDGSNRIVEMFGDYWHKGQNENHRIARFKEVGYECLVVWEKELRKNPIHALERVLTFLQ